jgi:hypothetical protein
MKIHKGIDIVKVIFTLWGKITGTNRREGPVAGLDIMEKRKSWPYLDYNASHPAHISLLY